MSIATELLNPQGRLGPKAFQKNGLILVAIGLVISLISAINIVLGGLLGIVSLVLIYPWVVIWVKRLHDAGKSGWLFLLVLLVWLIVSMIVGMIVGMIFASAGVAAGAAGYDSPRAIMSAMQAATVPSAICSAIVAVAFVFAGNAFLKSDPGPNKYGAPTEV